MSLINEALKKAQMEGRGKSAPAARNPDVASATANGRKPGVALIAGGVVALLAVAGIAGYVLTRDEPKPEPVATLAPKVVDATPPKGVSPATSESPPVVVPAPVQPVPVIVAKEIDPTVITTPAVAAPKAEVAPVAPIAPVVPVAPPAPTKNPEITEMLGRMKVTLGRKKTGRCVIDSVVFKVGDQLSQSPLIVIKSVTDTEVVFGDTNGVEYEKKYK